MLAHRKSQRAGAAHRRQPHEEGRSDYYATLLRWLESGAPADAGAVPTIDTLEVYPPAALLDGTGETQQLTVRAKYSDGTDRDVTSLAVFLSSNDNAAPVSKEGKVTAANRGEAFIMARFEKHTVGVPFIVLPKGLEFQWKEMPANNYIDELGLRQTPPAANSALRTVHRCGIYSPREPRYVRRAADVGRNRAVCRRRRPRQTRKAGRYAART